MTKLSKAQRATLERLAAGDTIIRYGDGVYRYTKTQEVASKSAVLKLHTAGLVNRRNGFAGLGVKYTITPSGRDILAAQPAD